ncbi:MAG: hypothetical protein NZ704_15420, partial [Geminicoccaceae bacterium]|nr:hypothetical protein [Geminicoccaceae bacterium]
MDRCFCRKCHGDPGAGGRWLDPIDYWRWAHGGTFAEAVAALAGGVITPARPALARPAAGDGGDDDERARWQRDAAALVARCEARLWAGDERAQRALRWLREERGLDDATIRAARLGYAPEPLREG